MLRVIKRLAGTLVVLFFMTGCQALTGQTMGETIDDSYITGAVKTQLASDKMVSLTRVELKPIMGLFISPAKSRPPSRGPEWVACVAGKGSQKGRQQPASDQGLEADWISVSVTKERVNA